MKGTVDKFAANTMMSFNAKGPEPAVIACLNFNNIAPDITDNAIPEVHIDSRMTAFKDVLQRSPNFTIGIFVPPDDMLMEKTLLKKLIDADLHVDTLSLHFKRPAQQARKKLHLSVWLVMCESAATNRTNIFVDALLVVEGILKDMDLPRIQDLSKC